MLDKLPLTITSRICRSLADGDPLNDKPSDLLSLTCTCRRLAFAASDPLWNRVKIVLNSDGDDRQLVDQLLSICSKPDHPLFRNARRVEVYYRLSAATSAASAEAPSSDTLACSMLLSHMLAKVHTLVHLSLGYTHIDLIATRDDVHVQNTHDQNLARISRSLAGSRDVAQSLTLNLLDPELLLDERQSESIQALSVKYVDSRQLSNLARFTHLTRLHLQNMDVTSSPTSASIFRLPSTLWKSLKTLIICRTCYDIDAVSVCISLLDSIQEAGGTQLQSFGFFIPTYPSMQMRLGHALAASGSTIKRLGLMTRGIVEPSQIRNLSTAFPHVKEIALLGTLGIPVPSNETTVPIMPAQEYGLALSQFEDLFKLSIDLETPHSGGPAVEFGMQMARARMDFARGIATQCQTLGEVGFRSTSVPRLGRQRICTLQTEALFFVEECQPFWWEPS